MPVRKTELSLAISLDESMSQWTQRYTIPNWTYCPRKPTPMGQQYHDMADAESHIAFVFEMVESGVKKYEDRMQSKMAAMCYRLLKRSKLLNDKERIVCGDSAFPSVELLCWLHMKGLHGIFAFKKKGSNWPKFIPGEELYKRTLALQFGKSTSRSAIFDFEEFEERGLEPLNMYICGL